MNAAPITYLDEAFDYDAESGSLKWRCRPRSHFVSDRAHANFNARFAGKEAGHAYRSTGYRIVCLGPHGYVGVHRIAVAMMTRQWPEFVDHINGNRLDNRAINLRACTKEENCRNRKRNVGNRSGFKGVSKAPGVRRWQARIQVNKKSINLGMFDTPELAHAAYVAAALQHHGAFANAG